MTARLVIGIGNPDRGDDGIGRLVIHRLTGHVPDDVTLSHLSGDILALIDDWAGRAAVILIDAAAPGTTPGAIHRIDLRYDALPTGLSLSSTHGFGVAEAVALARALGTLPDQLIAYAIEGADFTPGAPITQAVAAAADTVAARIAADLRHMTSETAHA